MARTAKPRDGQGRFARKSEPQTQEPSPPTEETRDDPEESPSGADAKPRRLIIRPAASTDGQGSSAKSSDDRPVRPAKTSDGRAGQRRPPKSTDDRPARPAKTSDDRAGQRRPQKSSDDRPARPAKSGDDRSGRARQKPKPQQVVVPRWKVLLRQLTR